MKPYAKNARTHSPEQIEQIAGLIDRYGFVKPVVIDEKDMILAGHGATAAAMKRQLKQIPVAILRGLTKPQKRAYVIADNKIALNSGWDHNLLTLELAELKVGGVDLGVLGFGEKELAKLLPDAKASGGHGMTFDPQYQVLIECSTEAEQLKLLERFMGERLKVRALIA